MATIIKPKRSETASSVPSTSDLVVGEVAVNTADKAIYVRDSGGNIVQVSNYAVADNTLIFPTGDYGGLTNPSTDAFNVYIEASFDCLDTPAGSLNEVDLGSLS